MTSYNSNYAEALNNLQNYIYKKKSSSGYRISHKKQTSHYSITIFLAPVQMSTHFFMSTSSGLNNLDLLYYFHRVESPPFPLYSKCKVNDPLSFIPINCNWTLQINFFKSRINCYLSFISFSSLIIRILTLYFELCLRLVLDEL